MNKTKDIRRAVRYLNSNAPERKKLDDAHIEFLVNQTIDNLNNGNYNFGACDELVVNTGNKKRYVKRYELFSTESILCQYIKQIIDRRFKVKYPNRM